MDARVKEGFLLFPIVSVQAPPSYFSSLFIFRNFSKATAPTKTWTKKRFILYRKSSQGIQRLEEKVSDDRDARKEKVIIRLNDCVKIWSPSSALIEIVTKDGSEHSLKVVDDDESADWLLQLQKVAFNLMEDKEEENQLYSGFNEDDTLFRVKAIASPVKMLLESPEYLLQLTPESILLLPHHSSEANPIYVWSLRDIRRYGSSAETFTLEAGRRCASGPGLFSFATPKGTYLFSLLSQFLSDLLQRDQGSKMGSSNTVHEAKEKPKKPPRKTKGNAADDRASPCLSLTPPPSPSSASNMGGSPSPSTSMSQDTDYAPEYENILTLSVASSSPLQRSPVFSTIVDVVGQTPPSHYLQNEVEYAVVLKDKRK